MKLFFVALVSLGALLGCRAANPAADARLGDAPGLDAAPDAAIDSLDGAPVRLPCTSVFGDALTANEFGRLDGYLVAIVPPGGSRPCRADSDHLHLQVRVVDKIYDIAINVGSDVHTATLDRRAFSPWAEGWHTGTGVFVDYPGLGLHAQTMPRSTTAALVSAITADLETVNHISIYATGYSTSDGAHLVHYNGRARDGMIVTKPLSPTAHMRAFSFDNSAF